MQAYISHFAKLSLVAVIALGGLVMSPHAVVHASSGNIDNSLGGEKEIGCYKQGCVQKHGNCLNHCLNDSTDLTITAVLNVAPNQIFVDSFGCFGRVHKPIKASALVAVPNRAPPSRELLRSVMKRE